MSEIQRWNKQMGMLWMERDGLRLVIHLPPAKGYVRFVVIDHGGSDRHPDRLIGSGTYEDVGTAKDAAERMAERLVTARRHRPDQRQDTSRERGIAEGESIVNVAYMSAFSALAGSAIGGVASIATTWLTQHSQDLSQRHAQSVGRREAVWRFHRRSVDVVH
jgi:hypothetical protein